MALISMFRHLEDNLDDWLVEELDNYQDDDYLVFDCPGICTRLVSCLSALLLLLLFICIVFLTLIDGKDYEEVEGSFEL
jgi:hypothetical protein